MEALLDNPIYAGLAIMIIICIIGYRMVGPIFDRIAARAKRDQKIDSTLENIEENQKKYIEAHEKHEAYCLKIKKETKDKVDNIEKEVGELKTQTQSNNDLLHKIIEKL